MKQTTTHSHTKIVLAALFVCCQSTVSIDMTGQVHLPFFVSYPLSWVEKHPYLFSAAVLVAGIVLVKSQIKNKKSVLSRTEQPSIDDSVAIENSLVHASNEDPVLKDEKEPLLKDQKAEKTVQDNHVEVEKKDSGKKTTVKNNGLFLTNKKVTQGEEQSDGIGRTFLHYAARDGRLSDVRSLIENGFNVNAEDEGKTTPLHLAVKYGHIDVVKFLIANGANTDKKYHYPFSHTMYNLIELAQAQKDFWQKQLTSVELEKLRVDRANDEIQKLEMIISVELEKLRVDRANDEIQRLEMVILYLKNIKETQTKIMRFAGLALRSEDIKFDYKAELN